MYYDTSYYDGGYYATAYYREGVTTPQQYLWGDKKQYDDDELLLILSIFYGIIS